MGLPYRLSHCAVCWYFCICAIVRLLERKLVICIVCPQAPGERVWEVIVGQSFLCSQVLLLPHGVHSPAGAGNASHSVIPFADHEDLESADHH